MDADARRKRAEEGRLSVGRIEEAHGVIDPVFTDSPQYGSESLDKRLGLRLVCKVETVNPIRSFKGRGAGYFLHRLLGEGRVPERLVCASAGNFGQGLAYAARAHGVPLTVFAAEGASPLKVERMRQLGATVRLEGADLDEAKEAARLFAGERGLRFVEDGREPEIAEGAGTIALELCRWPETLDALLVPLGNGALLAGVGTWVKSQVPRTAVVGVCAEGAPAMELSWRSGSRQITEAARTIADGIAVRVPVQEALADLRGVVDEILLVDDETIVRAMQLLHSELGLVVEPAGAAGVAAVMRYRQRFAEGLVATPLCGGNLTQEQTRRWLRV